MTANKSIAQYPILPNTGKYWAVPNPPMPILFYPYRPRTNWTDIVKCNLKNIDITWEEAKEVAADRTE